jgi:hypothetical protein
MVDNSLRVMDHRTEIKVIQRAFNQTFNLVATQIFMPILKQELPMCLKVALLQSLIWVLKNN